MLDLRKLSPAPWKCCPGAWGNGGVFPYVSIVHETVVDAKTDLEFIALARNTFDVMMRRGWYAVPQTADAKKWIVLNTFGVELEQGGNTGTYFIADNPFTALVEADRWYKENVDDKS